MSPEFFAQLLFSVSVRELVTFVCQTGDLGGSRDFVGSDRALKGIRGHQKIQRSRPAGYQKEFQISHEVKSAESILRIHGRIDGLLANDSEVLLEEIKTVTNSWLRKADSLHWAQAKIYGFMYAQAHSLEKLTLQLTYFNLETEELTEFRQSFSLVELAVFFKETTQVYLEWVNEHRRWCQLRDEAIKKLPFPFPQYRPGQREMAVVVFRTLSQGGRLFVEAPTGIGKTISVIFPALKSLAEGKLDQIFYLTARTIGRAVAEKAFQDLKQAGARVRALTLTARDKLCIRDGQPCDLQTCPLAIGYYDRCKPAIRDALNQEIITRPILEAISQTHQVCPFELSLDTSLWVDAVICDYNYVFDPQVYLRRHFAEPDRRYGFLVDEAHNLVDRGREMFSAEIDGREIDEVKRAIGKSVPPCTKTLSRLGSALRQFSPSSLGHETSPDIEERDLFTSVPLPKDFQNQSENQFVERRGGVLTSHNLPGNLIPLIEDALKAAENWLAQNQPTDFREALLQLYFRLHGFLRTADFYDASYRTIVESQDNMKVRLFCLDPASRIRTACEPAKAAVFFSGTLSPMDYFHALLGGEETDRQLQLPSPFPPENLAVLVNDKIRTDLKNRGATLGEVVNAIGDLVSGRQGNYLVYFPSYQYLNLALNQFSAAHPEVTIIEQKPKMSEAERDEFLTAFAADHDKTLVGFAVLGGIFGEGIDLTGERLIGAVIVGVGLPQLCVERDLIRDYFQERTGAGFEYAYTFPGMNRVLQAVGRVIRSETERGIVLLIDRRFAEARYRQLFPRHWQVVKNVNTAKIHDATKRLWTIG